MSLKSSLTATEKKHFREMALNSYVPNHFTAYGYKAVPVVYHFTQAELMSMSKRRIKQNHAHLHTIPPTLFVPSSYFEDGDHLKPVSRAYLYFLGIHAN